MHLVVVTGLVGNVRPKSLRRHYLRLKGRIEPDSPSVAFGREPDLLGKSSLELSDAQSRARSRVIDAKRAALQEKSIDDRSDGVGPRALPQVSQQEHRTRRGELGSAGAHSRFIDSTTVRFQGELPAYTDVRPPSFIGSASLVLPTYPYDVRTARVPTRSPQLL